MNTDLTYQVKMVVWLRELLYKKHKYYDGEETWTPADEAELQKVIAIDKDFYYSADLDIDLSDIDLAIVSKEKLAEYLKKLSKALNKLHGSNMPPKDVMEASEIALERRRAEIEEKNKNIPSLSSQRIKLISTFCSRFGISKEDARAFVDLATANIGTDPRFSVQEVLSVLENLDILTGRNPDILANYIVTSTLGPVIKESLVPFAEFISTQTGIPEGNATVTASAIAGFAGESPLKIVVTPEVESALVDVVGVGQANKEIGYLNNPKIIEAIKQAQEIYAQSQTTTEAIKKDFSKSEIKDEDAENQAIAAIKFAVPMMSPVYNKAKKEISNPSQLHQFEMFLKAMAIQYAKKYGLLLSPGAISLIEQSPLDKFFEQVEFQQEIPAQEQIQLTQELATESSETKAIKTDRASRTGEFAKDVVGLGEDFSLENVSGLANKWLNLEKIDSSLDRYFSDKDNLQYAQFQNWMAGVFAKFMGPEAEKLVNLLKPLNKIFWLLVDKSGLGQLLLWLKKTFKKWVGMNLLFGAVAGIGTFLIMGPLMGLGAGIITYFVMPSPAGTTSGSSLATTAARVNLAISHVGTAAIASFTSFLAIIFVVFLSIPIVIALLLFIINTSALVVPPNMDVFYNSSTELSSLGGAFQDDGLVNKSGCPLLNPTISVTSYSPFSQTGHGSNKYWSAVTGSSQNICRYAIPNRSGCYAPTKGPANNCLKMNLNSCEFYGFALDLVGSSDNISLPTVDGEEVNWTFNGTKYENGSGGSSVGWTFGYTDETNKYIIILTHVNENLLTGSSMPSGTKLGGLFKQQVIYADGSIHDNTHLHLEVQVDGKQYVRPENYFCNGK